MSTPQNKFGRFLSSRSMHLLSATAVAFGLTMAVTASSASARGTSAPALPTDLTKHIKEVYVRVILPMDEAAPVSKVLTGSLGGKIVYDFNFPAIKSRIIGVKSPGGNYSLELSTDIDGFDQWRKETRTMFVVDSVPATLDAARRHGLKVVQELNRTPIAMQGRFEVAPHFVVELISFLPKAEQRP